MRFSNKKISTVLKWGAKTLLVFGLTFLIFSPLGIALQTPQVRAQSIDFAGAEQSMVAECLAATPGKSQATCTQEVQTKLGTKPATGDICQSVSTCIASVVYVFTAGLAGLIAFIASYFLNLAIFISLNSTAYALNFLTESWVSVRDIANMGFIFILIYIAVSITLKAETSGTMKMLARVIVIALIINFSFFFVRLAIDVGNVLAINFYNNIAQQVPSLDSSLEKAGGITPQNISAGAADLTAPLMGVLSVQNLLSSDSFQKYTQAPDSSGFVVLISLSFAYICMGIILGLLAAMFFVIGIKFITRVVVLWVVIIASPLALLMYAMPSKMGEKWFGQWRDALIVYSIYPAIFLFLYIIIIKFSFGISTGCNTAAGCSIIADAFANQSSGVEHLASVVGTIIVKLGFLMVLLYMTIQASETVSKMGGSFAAKITSGPDKWAAGLAGLSRRITTAPVRFAGAAVTRPLGYGATKLNQTLQKTSWANSKGWYGFRPDTLIARSVQKNILQPVAKISVAGEKSYADYKEGWDKELKERGTNRRMTENLPVMQNLKVIIEKEQAGTTLTTTEARTKAILQRRVDNFTKQELEAQKIDDLIKHANVFKEAGAKKVAEIEKFSEAKREEFREEYSDKGLDSTNKKMDSSIKLLRKIHQDLVTSGLRIAKVDTHVGTTTTPSAPSTTIGTVEINDMRKDTKTQLAQVRSDIKQAPSTQSTFDLQQKLDTLQEVVKELDKAEEHLKKAPPGTVYLTK